MQKKSKKYSIKVFRTNRIGKIHNLAHHKSLGCLPPFTQLISHISFTNGNCAEKLATINFSAIEEKFH